MQFACRNFISACFGVNKGPHYEVRRAAINKAVDYCKKEGKFKEYGVCRGYVSVQGKRTDIEDAIKGCTNLIELATEFPAIFVKFHKGFEALFA